MFSKEVLCSGSSRLQSKSLDAIVCTHPDACTDVEALSAQFPHHPPSRGS